MRFEVIAAMAMGILLPVLETERRGLGHWLVDFTTMFEDYVAGALLLIAARAAIRRASFAPTLLLLAWAYNAGMMGPSLWYQVEETLRGVEPEPYNEVVIGFKLALWGTSMAGLILSYRRAIRGPAL